MRAILLVSLVVISLGCTSTEKMLKKVTYGEPFEGDYVAVLERAQVRLRKEFPKGLDPDMTDEKAGDLWTIWHNYKDMRYRSTVRRRAHVTVEDMGDGKVRIGVSVVQQINDNIDNPSIISEAKWVGKSYDQETAARIEHVIAQRYKKVDPSAAWKEKYKGGKSTTLRQDIIDRNKDVDLDSRTKIDSTEGLPTVTQKKDFWDPMDPLGRKKRKEDEDRDK